MNRNEWLNQVTEDTIEPDLEICDPHHHLWDYPENRYLLEELLEDTTSGHNVVSTVFMECGSMYRSSGLESLQPIGETEFVNGIAAMSASGQYGPSRACAGIVGFADLTLGAAVGDVLDRHMSVSERFRGIRHAAGWDPSEEVRNSHTNPTQHLYLDHTFQEGFKELGKRNLTFDAWLYHPQIGDLTQLARSFPDQVIVFDHFGGPLGIHAYAGKRSEIFDYWKGAVAELATCANVVAKLGGLVMPINGFGFHKHEVPPTSIELVEATRPYYMHMIEHFGVDRCMFESNFPVDKASCSYNVLWNSFKRLARDFSSADKASLFHDTATRVYSI
ncbi:MAG: amidohydrolase family protein [Gammaproteobacteria bacterium]|nr:amidohydrolase family protein [Gammaproteobacteria bacterium]MYD81072.1 amidohydrolase family protein [Gammaproteobacteria bacterium]